MKLLAVGCALTMALLGSTSLAMAATDLVTNGQFQTGNFSGWASSPTVNVIHESAYDGIQGTSHNTGDPFWAAFGGGNDPQLGSISQTITTAVGQLYTLTFNYGGWGDTSAQALNISIGDLITTVSAPVDQLTKAWSTFTNAQHTYSFTFTGTSNTTLKFADASGSSTNADGVLSNISVKAVPGPEAGTGLAGLAMAGIGFWAYRRKQAATAA